MARRTAAQKAATRKLIAWNKKRRKTKRVSKKRKSHKGRARNCR